MPTITKREVLAGAAAVAAASVLPVPVGAAASEALATPIAAVVAKPAWLLAAEATGTADFAYSFRLIDALIALLPSKQEGVSVDPEKFDADMQLELAWALHVGYAELTPNGQLRITPSGIRADEREWSCDE